MDNKLIAGVFSGHDSSYAVLNKDGNPIIHWEHERYSRIKESRTDSVKFLLNTFDKDKINQIKYLTSVYPKNKLTNYKESWNQINQIINQNDGKIQFISHHLAHAANTFFCSNYDKATIITIDGGGVESEQGHETACAIWLGEDKTIKNLNTYHSHKINVGGAWSRYLLYIFDLPNSSPHGGAHGTLMSHSNYGDPNRFKKDFLKMMTEDLTISSMKPSGQLDVWKKGGNPQHPYLYKWKQICDQSEQNMFDLAAGLQAATEEILNGVVREALELSPIKDTICLSGGCSLNSVWTGKLWDVFPQLKNIYVVNTVGDCGLSIGSAQYICHNILGTPRKKYYFNFSPYQGKKSLKDEIFLELTKYKNDKKLEFRQSSDEEIIKLIIQKNIVSVFGGKDECGKRALGNKSILADPRYLEIKNIINTRTKNRDNLRPFAPSILREDVKDYFVKDIESPYMSFVISYKDGIKEKIPAVDHFNTGRLQTVRKEDNKWYYNFLQLWKEKTGCSVLLNTSFNNQTPICSSPVDAIECYLNCRIDYLYFSDEKLLVIKSRELKVNDIFESVKENIFGEKLNKIRNEELKKLEDL